MNRRDLIGTLVGICAGIGTVVSIKEAKPKSVECPVDAHDADEGSEWMGWPKRRELQAEANQMANRRLATIKQVSPKGFGGLMNGTVKITFNGKVHCLNVKVIA